jgi:hypothetical protein
VKPHSQDTTCTEWLPAAGTQTASLSRQYLRFVRGRLLILGIMIVVLAVSLLCDVATGPSARGCPA